MMSNATSPGPRKTIVLIACLLDAFALGCGRDRPADLSDYLTWVNDRKNGLVVSHEGAGHNYTLKYLPTEYLMARDRQGTGLPNSDSSSVRRQYDSICYFLLTISSDGQSSSRISNDSSFAQSLQELSLTNELRNRFFIRCGTANIVPASAWAESTMGLSDRQSIMIAFPLSQVAQSDSFLVVFDGRPFDKDEQRFQFFTRDIKRAPQI